MHACMLICFNRILVFVTLWTIVHRAPLSMGFSRQEHWSGLSCLPPGDPPDPGIKPASLTSSCTGRQVLYNQPLEAQEIAYNLLNPYFGSLASQHLFSALGISSAARESSQVETHFHKVGSHGCIQQLSCKANGAKEFKADAGCYRLIVKQ